MEAQTTRKLYTFDEYLALEQTEGVRYEYYDGDVVAYKIPSLKCYMFVS